MRASGMHSGPGYRGQMRPGEAMKGFKNFLMQGNFVTLAVAVVIGVALNTVVQALVADLITPLITAAGGGKTNFANLAATVHGGVFKYGLVLNALLSFIIIALVVYYFLVAPNERLTTLASRKKAATTRDCPECLSTIPIGATRCMYCTAQVPPVATPAADVPQPRRFRHGHVASE
jgi:large conductance mechanosensitive channel